MILDWILRRAIGSADAAAVARSLSRLATLPCKQVSRERIILLDIEGLLASIAAESDETE